MTDEEQKQIEKTCETIASMICEIYNPQCDEYEPHTCSHCYANTTKIGDFAEMLYNADYRKVDEVRKETAKEILTELSNISVGGLVMKLKNYPQFKEICKKYQVEVI